jgi:hypothetical protein
MKENMTRQTLWARRNYKKNRRKRLAWEKSHQILLMWHRAKNRAKKLGVPFTISVEDIQIPKVCPVLHTPIRWRAKNRDNSPSLDRRRADLGYVPGNVVVISNRANRIKSDATAAELWFVWNYCRRQILLDTGVDNLLG